MKRLAVPILIVLLMLLAGAVWALFVHLDLPQFAGGPSQPATISEQQTAPEKSASGRAQAPGDEQASFDVARIDPQGTSVFAGRAEPGSTVTIMDDGKAIGTAEADENGEWTFATEHPFASAEPKLALTVKSAAETKAEVAGSLETREAAQPPPQAQPPKSEPGKKVTAELLKDFEGIVAAARTEAQEEKAREEKAQEEKAQEAKKAEEQPAKVPEPSVGKVEEEKAAVPPSKPEAAPEPPKQQTPEPQQQAAVAPPTPPPTVAPSESKPSAPPMRLAAPAPEAQADRKSIPVPITFVYNEANFTEDGRKAAALLLEYLQLKRFPRVSLTGHADERGSHEFNMDLSRERLGTVAQFLKEGGFNGELELVPKGETEPFTGVVRSQYPREDLYQFDRRVELIIAR